MTRRVCTACYGPLEPAPDSPICADCIATGKPVWYDLIYCEITTMNYNITITPTINGWIVEKRTFNNGQLSRFVYPNVALIQEDLLNVINYEPPLSPDGENQSNSAISKGVTRL